MNEFVFIHITEIARMEKASGVDRLLRCGFVVVIAKHDVRSFNRNLADSCGVWRIDFQLRSRHRHSCGIVFKVAVSVQCCDRSAFRKAISLDRQNAKVSEILTHLRIDCRSAGNKQAHMASKAFMDLCKQLFRAIHADFTKNGIQTKGKFNLSCKALLPNRVPNPSVHRFQHQRNYQHHRDLAFRHVLCNMTQALAICNGAASVYRTEKAAGTFVCMMNRKN